LWADASFLTLSPQDRAVPQSANTPPATAGEENVPPDPTAGRWFDFNWLFSGGDVASPAEAVIEAALDGMTEVQARLIAVSPPIAIEG